MSSASTSATRETLSSTARRFIVTLSTRLATGGIDKPSLAALCAPDYTHTFGPAHFVSQRPPLQGALDIAGLAAHVERMLPMMDEVKFDVVDVVVDESARRVVARVLYGMYVRGSEGSVENEVVWWFEMNGEGKVARSREMVDGVAAGRIGELVGALKK